MRKVLKLAVASLREHPVRVLLTTLATMASTCLVVWIASGYDALLASFDAYANLALGRYELSIAPISVAEDRFVPREVLDELRADPAVAAVEPMWLRKVTARPAGEATEAKPLPALPEGTRRRPGVGEGYGAGPNAVLPEAWLLATDSREPPFDPLRGRWLDSAAPETLEAVLRADVAERFELDVGDELQVGEGKRTARLKVVGLVDAPATIAQAETGINRILTPGTGEVFVSSRVAEQVLGRPAEITFLAVALQEEADLTKFRFSWGPKLSRHSTPVQFQESVDIEEALDEAAAATNVKLQAYATTGIAMLVALLAILCTLSMGVNERVRQFAVLRAIGLTRSQIAWLIGLEGLLLATFGFLGGLALGQSLLWLTVRASGAVLHHGATLGFQSLLLGAISVYGGGLLAAIIPAWRATSVRPVDAMGPQRTAAPGVSLKLRLALIGLALILVNPLLTFVFPPEFEGGVFAAMAVGFAAMGIGFVLVAPALVALTDRWVSPLLARCLGIDRKLLASQLTSHLWRTVGAAVSLAVGMGLYVSVHVWGMTMLDAFIPGPWAPDALVAFQPWGIPPEKAAKVAEFPGVDPNRSQPIVVEQPRLLHDLTRSAERASVTRQDNVVIVGIDGAGAFGGEQPLFDLEWVAGSPESVIPVIESGRGCVVPDHFLAETGLNVGDSFELTPPENPDHPVRYVIAGAAKLPGWHWQTKPTGFRSRTHRAAAIVFADYRTVAADFELPTASYVWLSYDSPEANPDQIASAAAALYSQALKQDVLVGSGSPGAPSVKIMPVENIRDMTRGAASRWLWILSQIPLIAVGIACIGVVNVMLASVRARRWELGVLRAIGVTRSQIVRAILAEGLLIGFVACLLSLGFGIMAGWCGVGIAQYVSFFGGVSPALAIPWQPLVYGLLVFLTLSVLTALWPAVQIGRTRPHLLLQQGRGAF